jgi:hypothetical protein
MAWRDGAQRGGEHGPALKSTKPNHTQKPISKVPFPTYLKPAPRANPSVPPASTAPTRAIAAAHCVKQAGSMPAAHGLCARSTPSRAPFRKKGYIPLTTYLRLYKISDYIDVKVNGVASRVCRHRRHQS